MIFVTHDELRRILEERLENMSTQADADALTAQVTQIATDLATAVTTLQAEIDQLAAAASGTGAPPVDLTGLTAAVAPLDAAVKAAGALSPTPAAPVVLPVPPVPPGVPPAGPATIFGTPPPAGA